MKKVMLILGFMVNVLLLTGCQSDNDMQTKETLVSSSVQQYTQASSIPNVQFSDEELVSAFYLESFIDGDEKKTIEDSYHWLTQEHPGEVHFNKVDDEYIMDYSTKGSRLHFKIKGNTIEKFGEYEVDELLGSQTKEDLTNKYQTHQELVKNLLLLSKNNQKIYEKEQHQSEYNESIKEDSKEISLTNDEAIGWVKEVLYMKPNVTNESVDNLVYTQENDQSDGLLHIRVSMPQSDTIGIFRITEDGMLEVSGTITGQPLLNSKWQTISKQYMDKETAKEYFDSRK